MQTEQYIPTFNRIFEKIEQIKKETESSYKFFDCIMYGNKIQSPVCEVETSLKDFDAYVVERIDAELGEALGAIKSLKNRIEQQKEIIVG